MPRKLTLSATQIELRLANTGMTIRVEDDQGDRSGRLQVSKTGLRWTPKYKWHGGPQSVRIAWERVPEIFKAESDREVASQS